jgi:hypothetical protein
LNENYSACLIALGFSWPSDDDGRGGAADTTRRRGAIVSPGGIAEFKVGAVEGGTTTISPAIEERRRLGRSDNGPRKNNYILSDRSD